MNFMRFVKGAFADLQALLRESGQFAARSARLQVLLSRVILSEATQPLPLW